MASDSSGGACRVVARRRCSAPFPPPLSACDQRLLAVLCEHRVVTQTQLERLFEGVPARTLRYRTRRLHELGLAGRSRPYRERGSAPHHHWPTRRADCLMRGEPVPRGGERHGPNPMFLAHAAALSGLYVVLATEGERAGLRLTGYRREGQAREPFAHAGGERALAPDALLAFQDGEGREFRAFVELDRGSMSHARLRQKAELYAAYIESGAWRSTHPFLPALLFLTTADPRGEKFLAALARVLSYGPRRGSSRRPFVAAAAGVAFSPARLVTQPCLRDLDGNSGLALIDVLAAARAPYEHALSQQREREQQEQRRRDALRDDPQVMRQWLCGHRGILDGYLRGLGDPGKLTIELLCDEHGSPDSQEGAVLAAIACDLYGLLPEPTPGELPAPGGSVGFEVGLLVEQYRAAQAERLRELASRFGDGPSLARAKQTLAAGGLLDRFGRGRLALDAERDAESRRAQQARRDAYLAWREMAARQLARRAGPLGRLTHRPEDFYTQIDGERLRVCVSCGEIAFPPQDVRSRPHCHFCTESAMKPYQPQTGGSEVAR